MQWTSKPARASSPIKKKDVRSAEEKQLLLSTGAGSQWTGSFNNCAYIQVNKTYFHPRCMKCQVCDELQTSRYITYKDLPICEEDYKVRNQMMITKQRLKNLSEEGDGFGKCLKHNEKSER